MKEVQWANFVFREVVWLGAFVWFAYLKKPPEAGFLEVRNGLIGVIGIGLVAVGAVMHVWSAKTLARAISSPTSSTDGLARTGPFAYVRNPIYLAGAIVFVGICLVYAMPRGVELVAAAVIAIGLHFIVVRIEEPATRMRLGAEYEEYCRRVPRWIPRLWRPE